MTEILLTVCLAVIFICLVGLIICQYFMVRNDWVAHNMVELIGTEDYDKLPSYDEILYGRFWCWNFKSYYKKQEVTQKTGATISNINPNKAH